MARPDRSRPRGCGQLDDPVALLTVDGVDPAQQVRQVHGAVKVGTGLQRPDVLGKAASAEADAGLEEAPADARVVADGVGQDGDVGPAVSHRWAMALMKLILVARKEFAAVLTSSAVG